MIKQSREGIELEGTVPQIMTDLTVIVRNVNEVLIEFGMSEEEAKDTLQHSFDLGFKPYEELKKDAVEKLQEMIGDEPNVVLDFIKAMLGIDDEESKDESDADFKVWCETNDIRDKALNYMEDKGIVWMFGDEKPTEWKEGLFEAPMGMLVLSNRISQTKNKITFKKANEREIKADDLLNEKVGAKHE